MRASIEPALATANDLAIRLAFEAAGVEFIDENGGGPTAVRPGPTGCRASDEDDGWGVGTGANG